MNTQDFEKQRQCLIISVYKYLSLEYFGFGDLNITKMWTSDVSRKEWGGGKRIKEIENPTSEKRFLKTEYIKLN